MSEALFEELLDDLYQAATDVSRWPFVLEKMCRFLDSTAVQVLAVDMERRELNFCFFMGLNSMIQSKS